MVPSPRQGAKRRLSVRTRAPYQEVGRLRSDLKFVIGTIAITDQIWYEFLASHPELKEVNFWTPSARRGFRSEQFSPFLFKLRAPSNAVCGFAFFAQYLRLPLWLAWESFGIGNGCASEAEMQARIGRLRERIRYEEDTGANDIGCIQLVMPTFFSRDEWIAQPTDWHPRTQSYERYDLDSGEGKRVWEACVTRKGLRAPAGLGETLRSSQDVARYGDPILVEPRLGQRTFRIAVLDAYERSCAVTGEHSLPALEASHIQPYARQGPHDVRNGLLFRADIHRLFDRGYITVTPELKLEVSARLKNEFKNGRSYYPLHGSAIRSPALGRFRAAPEFLTWHNENIFRA